MPMQTRSSLSSQILGKRKRRSERKEQELQRLFEAAGVDRPDISTFTDSTVRTRRRTKERIRPQSVQAVLESLDISRHPSRLSEARPQAQGSGDINSGSRQTKSPAASTASTTKPGQTDLKIPGKFFSALSSPSYPEPAATASQAVPEPRSTTEKPFTFQTNPVGCRKRKQLEAIRGAIDRETRNKPSNSRSTLMNGLKKALWKLERTPQRHPPSSPSKFPRNLFSVWDGLSNPSKRSKFISRRSLYRSPPESRNNHFPILAGLRSSTLQNPTAASPQDPTIYISLPQDSLYINQAVEKESPSLTAGKAASEIFPISSSSSDLLASRVNISDGGLLKSSKKTTIAEKKEDLDVAKMSNHRHAVQDGIALNHAIPDASEDQNQELPKGIFPLTKECKHYTHVSQVDWDIQKYWYQRKSIFSLYDEGIRMTEDAWFGVTPEPVANKVADDFAAFCNSSKTIIIDMFAGAGGNTIAFALSGRWSQVIGIEKDASAIACAQHNAAIYGVADQITFLNEDSFSYLTTNSSSIDVLQTAIFASPPWGGPGYRSDEVFNLSTMAPYSAKKIHSVCKGMDSALYLPRTSDLRQIARLAPEGKKVEVVQYCMEGASKALVAYIPAASPIAPF